MLTLIERGYSYDSKRHRAQLYLGTYALLGLTFIATVAESGASTEFFVPLYFLSLLTGCLALLLRTDWFSKPPRTASEGSRPRAVPTPPPDRLDRIANLRSDRYANRSLDSLAAAFPEFEQKNATATQPAKDAPQKNSRPRDPFFSALWDFDNRKRP